MTDHNPRTRRAGINGPHLLPEELAGALHDRGPEETPGAPVTDLPVRLRVYLEPRDFWIGAYIASDAVYVCPLPFLVFRWRRK